MSERQWLSVDDHTRVSALLSHQESARALLVLAHGAGAGMQHVFMEALTERLVARELAVLRYQFPYKEAGRRRPDPQQRLLTTVRAAIALGAELAAKHPTARPLPLFAGGKSMGGRMTSLAAADAPLDERVRGLFFVGFPLHAAKKPATRRGEHLAATTQPLLFLQGTRDALAERALLEPIVDDLGERATMHVVEGADHGFHVLQRSGRNDDEVLDELADALRTWVNARG